MSGKPSALATALRSALSLAVAIVLACLVAWYERIAFRGEELSLARRCCDGAFVSAVLFLSLGGLSFVSHWGGFDAVSYALTSFADIFRRPERRRGKASYADYVHAKHDGRHRPSLRLLIVGAVMLVAALALLWVPGNYG